MALEIRALQQSLGQDLLSADEWSAFCESLTKRPRPAVRLRDSASECGWTDIVPWGSQGRWISPNDSPGSRWEYASGQYYIQDAASLLAVELLDPQPRDRVCDLCAAPGGKSTAILERIRVYQSEFPRILDTGGLLANEPVKSRLAPLSFNLARHGSVAYCVTSLDPDQLAEKLPRQFDRVLVDAPCSGQSLLGRGKQSQAAFTTRQIGHSAQRQTRILAAAERLVRPGGVLVYCTCTFAREENEDQVRTFAENFAGWAISPEPRLQHWESHLMSGTYRLWPHRESCGGAFAARLTYQGDDEVHLASRKNKKDKPPAIPLGDWGELQQVERRLRGQIAYGWPASFPPEWLNIAIGGPEISFQKGQTWQPSYALAMRRDQNWLPQRTIDLTEQQVVAYLAGQTIDTDQKGWTVATHQQQPLGWIKGDGRIGKNHLPKPGRLQLR